VLTLGRALLAVSRATKGVISKAELRRLARIGNQPDIATAATVAPVESTLGHVRLAAKTDAALPPSPALAWSCAESTKLDTPLSYGTTA
jgi:hypothetical protein